MGQLGLRGVVRGCRVRTTIPDTLAERPAGSGPARLHAADRPNQLWVADLTYVATWRGFVYVAFVIDVFSRRIVGWRASSPCGAIWRSTPWSRRSTIGRPTADLVHHSDRGVQYLSIRYTERLAEAGIEPSVGSRGDSYDNALAESVIGLFKTEVIRRRGPVARPRGRRVRHAGVGGLVQHAAPAGTARLSSPRRSTRSSSTALRPLQRMGALT